MGHVSPLINFAVVAAKVQGALFLLAGGATAIITVMAVDQGYRLIGSRLPLIASLLFYLGVGGLFFFVGMKMESAALWPFVVAVTVSSVLVVLLLAAMFLGGKIGPCCLYPVLALSSVHVVVRCWGAFPELRFYGRPRAGSVTRSKGFEPILPASPSRPATNPLPPAQAPPKKPQQ